MSTTLRLQIRTEFDAVRAALESTHFARTVGFEDTPSRLIATAVLGGGQLHHYPV